MSDIKSVKKLKIGIIGCGFVAKEYKLPSLSKLGNVELAAFCDCKLERAQEYARTYGAKDAKTYMNYKEMLKDKSIDAVHIFTPNKLHSTMAIDALEAGKHVMCEKPMAVNAKEARKMYEAAKKADKKLSVGYQVRFRHDYQHLKQICERGDLGEIYFARAYAIRRRAVPTWGAFLNKEEQGGGPLIDIGCHALDLTLWLMDNYKVKSVMGNVYHKLANRRNAPNLWGPWDPDKFQVEDSAFGFITMESGATIIVETSWALNTVDTGEEEVTLCGTEGGASVKQNQILRLNGEKSGELFVSVYRKPAKEVESDTDKEARLWIESISNDTPYIVKPEQTLVVDEVLDAIYESGKTGKAVYFGG